MRRLELAARVSSLCSRAGRERESPSPKGQLRLSCTPARHGHGSRDDARRTAAAARVQGTLLEALLQQVQRLSAAVAAKIASPAARPRALASVSAGPGGAGHAGGRACAGTADACGVENAKTLSCAHLVFVLHWLLGPWPG